MRGKPAAGSESDAAVCREAERDREWVRARQWRHPAKASIGAFPRGGGGCFHMCSGLEATTPCLKWHGLAGQSATARPRLHCRGTRSSERCVGRGRQRPRGATRAQIMEPPGGTGVLRRADIRCPARRLIGLSPHVVALEPASSALALLQSLFRSGCAVALASVEALATANSLHSVCRDGGGLGYAVLGACGSRRRRGDSAGPKGRRRARADCGWRGERTRGGRLAQKRRDPRGGGGTPTRVVHGPRASLLVLE